MITPLHQAEFGPEKGNCWGTCIAMITGIPLEEIPNFCVNHNKAWWGDTVKWLLPRGWVGIYMHREAWDAMKACCWAAREAGIPMILGAKSPRFEGALHAVVMAGGKQYDPHPEGSGFNEDDVQDVAILIPVAAYLAPAAVRALNNQRDVAEVQRVENEGYALQARLIGKALAEMPEWEAVFRQVLYRGGLPKQIPQFVPDDGVVGILVPKYENQWIRVRVEEFKILRAVEQLALKWNGLNVTGIFTDPLILYVGYHVPIGGQES